MKLMEHETQEQAIAAYNNGHYKERLEQGLIYQDMVTRELYQRGIVIVGYSSRRYQLEQGENMLGAEIKRDGNFRKTGNLYIETAEKSHPSRANYVPSGIMRMDNSWLFVIGDEQTIYIFATCHLRKMCQRPMWKKITTPTSIGRLMPLADAEKYCIRRIDMQ